MGVPQVRWMVYFMENPIEMGDQWGTPISGNLHMNPITSKRRPTDEGQVFKCFLD